MQAVYCASTDCVHSIQGIGMGFKRRERALAEFGTMFGAQQACAFSSVEAPPQRQQHKQSEEGGNG